MKETLILNLSTKAGKIMLENGGETYRVERIIKNIGKNFGYNINSYATLTGIISTLETHEKRYLTNTLRIEKRTIDLDKVQKINELSDNIEKFDINEVEDILNNISYQKGYKIFTGVFSYIMISGIFSLLYGGDFKDFIGSSIIGFIIFIYTHFLSNLEINTFFLNGLGSMIIATISIFLNKIGVTSSIDMTIIGPLMLFVPGLALTNAVRDVINGDLMAGLARGLDAFFSATSLAIGTGIIITFFAN
jgi:uncharacterized membrane protein YjjP (DUF1212 family)